MDSTTEFISVLGKSLASYIEKSNKYREERNAAVEDIRLLGRMGHNICPVCTHYNHGAGSPEHCPKALKEDCFEWRGVKHE